MRLADVKWVRDQEVGYNRTWVLWGCDEDFEGRLVQVVDHVSIIGTRIPARYMAYWSDDRERELPIGNNPLELACWLADKEPADAPDPHSEYEPHD